MFGNGLSFQTHGRECHLARNQAVPREDYERPNTAVRPAQLPKLSIRFDGCRSGRRLVVPGAERRRRAGRAGHRHFVAGMACRATDAEAVRRASATASRFHLEDAMSSPINRVLLFASILLAGCTVAQSEVFTPVATPATPCPYNFPAKWHEIANSQAQTAPSDIAREASSFVQESVEPLSSSSKYDYGKSIVYVLKHPEDPGVIFVKYILVVNEGHWGGYQPYLLRRIGKRWTTLKLPANPADCCYAPSVYYLALVGLAKECNGWSLYIGMGSADRRYGGVSPYTYFFHSRDNGVTWWPKAYALSQDDVMRVPIRGDYPPLPVGAAMQGRYYDDNEHLLTYFSWAEDSQTLYAFSSPFYPTPTPSVLQRLTLTP